MGQVNKPSVLWTPPVSAIFGVLVTIGLVALVYLIAGQSALSFGYGYGVFCGVPLSLGYFSVLVVGSDAGVLRFRRCASTAMWAISLASLGFFALGAEGFICILMAAPIAIPMSLVGASLALGTRRWGQSINQKRASSVIVLGFVPLMLFKDVFAPLPLVRHVESTSIVIGAPPERVWPYLSNLSDLPKSQHLLFRSGIACPMGIKTIGSGVGAHRVCRLSTGDMPEIIEVFEFARRLDFKVLATPPCMV